MFCVRRRNSIGRFYRPVCFLYLVNARESFASAKTNFWWVLTVKAAFPWKILRLHSWTSWNSRSTRATDSPLGIEDKALHERIGGARSLSPAADELYDNRKR